MMSFLYHHISSFLWSQTTKVSETNRI